ncbi:hypothetical protein HanIR_Chr15g0746481 [Helianthus annuus]|nr:hypothetical protein HanIR_Chr15g0746481 [Helianthus annuus]
MIPRVKGTEDILSDTAMETSMEPTNEAQKGCNEVARNDMTDVESPKMIENIEETTRNLTVEFEEAVSDGGEHHAIGDGPLKIVSTIDGCEAGKVEEVGSREDDAVAGVSSSLNDKDIGGTAEVCDAVVERDEVVAIETEHFEAAQDEKVCSMAADADAGIVTSCNEKDIGGRRLNEKPADDINMVLAQELPKVGCSASGQELAAGETNDDQVAHVRGSCDIAPKPIVKDAAFCRMFDVGTGSDCEPHGNMAPLPDNVEEGKATKETIDSKNDVGNEDVGKDILQIAVYDGLTGALV